jgi:hypothetical protein
MAGDPGKECAPTDPAVICHSGSKCLKRLSALNRYWWLYFLSGRDETSVPYGT